MLVTNANIPCYTRLGRLRKSTLYYKLTARLLSISYSKTMPSTAVELSDHVYNRMLLSFTNAIYFFARDVGGVEVVI